MLPVETEHQESKGLAIVFCIVTSAIQHDHAYLFFPSRCAVDYVSMRGPSCMHDATETRTNSAGWRDVGRI